MLILLFAFLAAPPPVEVAATGKIVSENFTGVGYHAEMFLDSVTPEFFDQVIAKRWRELNPGFARIFHHWARRQPGVRDQAHLDALLKQILFMKESAGTEIYLTTSSPKDTAEGPEREAYAKAAIDELAYLLERGATNITTYNMSNELSMGRWAAMVRDLPKFKDYHRLMHAEIARRGLKIALLSTDASPINNWHTLEWAAQNMDDITEVYGGHHYANDHAPGDLAFYGWFREKVAGAVKLARSKGKEFILGEFGPAQYLQHKYGVRWDAQRYFDTPLEPLSGLQTAEAALAAMNGGARAMGYWTFMDYPESDRNFVNHWGLFQYMKNGGLVRAPYYSYGMMSKYFRGPATVYEAAVSDPLIRSGIARHRETGRWSVAVISRAETPVTVSVRLPDGAGNLALRKYVYEAASPPKTEDGDLQPHSSVVRAAGGRFTDTAAPLSFNIYTGYYDDDPPSAATGLKAQIVSYAPGGQQEMRAQKLTWTPSTSSDVIYYRIFYDGRRIGSTVSPEYTDGDVRRAAGHKYAVVAVDSSGNASRPVECEAAARQ